MDRSKQLAAEDNGSSERRQMAHHAHQGENTLNELRNNGPHTLPGNPVGNWNEAVAELTLLVPHWQLEALEWAAACRGLTMAQLLRSLISNCIGGLDGVRPTQDFNLLNSKVAECNAGIGTDQAVGEL